MACIDSEKDERHNFVGSCSLVTISSNLKAFPARAPGHAASLPGCLLQTSLFPAFRSRPKLNFLQKCSWSPAQRGPIPLCHITHFHSLLQLLTLWNAPGPRQCIHIPCASSPRMWAGVFPKLAHSSAPATILHTGSSWNHRSWKTSSEFILGPGSWCPLWIDCLSPEAIRPEAGMQTGLWAVETAVSTWRAALGGKGPPLRLRQAAALSHRGCSSRPRSPSHSPRVDMPAVVTDRSPCSRGQPMGKQGRLWI